MHLTIRSFGSRQGCVGRYRNYLVLEGAKTIDMVQATDNLRAIDKVKALYPDATVYLWTKLVPGKVAEPARGHAEHMRRKRAEAAGARAAGKLAAMDANVAARAVEAQKVQEALENKRLIAQIQAELDEEADRDDALHPEDDGEEELETVDDANDYSDEPPV